MPASSITSAGHPQGHAHESKSSIKETVISIVIAFALAFVFRGFVVEAFLIPTGSMAPTLLGKNMLIRGERSGYEWTVGPLDYFPRTTEPTPLQGTASRKLEVTDPMTLEKVPPKIGAPLRAGDRIFVIKYLESLFDPSRFDIVVFKNPTDPSVNYIKRLIGLPGDQIALVDGDVFARPASMADDAPDGNAWLGQGWKICRKPELSQRAMWQLVFDSRYTPTDEEAGRKYASPWVPPAGAAGWETAGRKSYSYTGSGPTSLAWDVQKRPINDFYPYNETSPGPKNGSFPVSDIRLSLGLEPKQAGMIFRAKIAARGHEFRASIVPSTAKEGGYAAVLEMRPIGSTAEWTRLGGGRAGVDLKPGEVVNFDFWHADQSLTLFINDKEVAHGSYEWSPAERMTFATTLGANWTRVASAGQGSENDLMLRTTYHSPTAGFEFEGGAFVAHRVSISRDIHYQAAVFVQGNRPGEQHSRYGRPATATHPSSVLTLGPDQYFVCGDNSPSSLDCRLLDVPDPWVAELDSTMGVVPGDLMIGKAFFVYFPAPGWRKSIPIPDFGRMRFIF